MEEKFYRDSWIEVNLQHIQYNIEQLRDRLEAHTGIYAVVKANGYGHGDVEVAKVALQAGANRLAVALLDEALHLREAGIEAPILVMGRTRPEDVPLAVEKDITLTCYQKEWLQEVVDLELSQPVTIHLKWDTGMGRIGLRTEEELLDILPLLKNETFHVEGVYTHFATADEEDVAYFNQQLTKFETLQSFFAKHWSQLLIMHTGNSAASMRFPKKMQHFIRYGISMYGLYPSPIVKKENPINLRPALSLFSRLTHVKKVNKGEAISYGSTYRAEKEEWIGTVPLGYADGIRRALQGMEVLVNGERCEIVGRICMDQLMVRLTKEAKIGDKVTLIGTDEHETIEMDDVAEYLDTINYEVACMLSARIPRVYIR
ncbi:alanine racemase [Gracilibacillus halotolerans]|uniref:Alanine racemase n=1 Tax=Gracilibacillus halotolerans TaxID=74386 RepID=A0A841RG55_9BACI|nr:alanine racemase [Gracilibacillus halotolerans]MBB6513100.1 alanine racemase [Gracilibacillus halotolerans]